MKDKEESLSTNLLISDILYCRFRKDLITDYILNKDPMIHMPVSGVLVRTHFDGSYQIDTACYGSENDILCALTIVLLEKIKHSAGADLEKRARLLQVFLNYFNEKTYEVLFSDTESEDTETEWL